MQKHFEKWTQFCKFNIHIFYKECTQFCTFYLRNFLMNVPNFVYLTYTIFHRMNSVPYIQHTYFQWICTILYIQSTKFFKKCTQLYTFNIQHFSKNIHHFLKNVYCKDRVWCPSPKSRWTKAQKAQYNEFIESGLETRL